MFAAKDQHGPQPRGALAGPADVDAGSFHAPQKVVALRGVPGDEGALAFAAQVAHLVRVFVRQLLQGVVQFAADFCL